MARLEPFVAVDERCKRILILPPGHYIPGERLVGGAAFRFEGQRMASFVRSERKSERHPILCITVDAIRAEFFH